MPTLLQNRAFSLLAIFALAMNLISSAHAQLIPAVLDISPTANNVSEEIPPAPARVSLFGWQGVTGTRYDIRFEIEDEPSLIVGVGAQVLTSSFDTATNILSVAVLYSGEKILADDAIELPENTFLIALDPGVSASVLPLKAKSKVHSRATQLSQPCYGPGAKPGLYRDTSGDFGEDDGLNDPEETSNDEQLVGLPTTAAGTFASTNVFYWCVVPPRGSTQGVGLRLKGAKNETARVSMTLSPSLLSFMGSRLGRTVASTNLAIFSDELQVAVDVDNSSDGATASLTLPLDSKSTKVTVTGTADAGTAPAEVDANASDLEQRTISLGVKEPLSLAPDSLQVIGKKVLFSGFVDDPALVGLFVEILRIGSAGKCTIKISDGGTVRGTVIARGKIQADGSFNVQIPASAVFNQNKKNSRIVAQIPGESARASREVSLTNRNRNLRQ